MAPHLVVQWGKEVLHPVVQGGMLPRPQGVQVGTVVLEEGIPQMFLAGGNELPPFDCRGVVRNLAEALQKEGTWPLAEVGK